MTSIHTNVGAISALQTLRSIAGQMGDTQNQVSSGLRVGTASDNAAYWSIATTMRSDNMAYSAVADALGLGAAKVDTAYAGMEAVVDVLKEFKARLVAATEEGVDETKIQTELEQLKQQIVSIASSASFNGVNWLSTDVAELGEAVSSITSSFVRTENGDVAVKKTDVALTSTALFNTSGGGLLQKGKPTDYGGMLTDPPFNYAWSFERYNVPAAGAWPAGATVTFDVLLDGPTPDTGTPYAVTIDQATVLAALGTDTISGGSDMGKVVQKALELQGVPATAYGYGPNADYPVGYFLITSSDAVNGLYSSVKVDTVVSNLPGAEDFGLTNSIQSQHNGYTTAYMTFSESFVLNDNHEFSFDVEINGSPVQTYTVTESDINTVLGDGNGVVSSAAEYAEVLRHVMAGSGLNISSYTYGDGMQEVRFRIDPAIHPEQGRNSRIDFSNIDGNEALFDLLDVDITDDEIDLDTYIMGVEKMLRKTVSAASHLGALQARIDTQTEFTNKLSDSIDSGIGRLVDADMNEASTRLKALQTQEQLAIQSLSIANSDAESILTLFR